MDDEQYPANSHTSKDEPVGKNLGQVTSTAATRRKKPLSSKLKETFIQGSIKGALSYVTLDILLPTVRDMLWEAASGGIEKLIFGESRRSRTTSPSHGNQGYVPYNRYSTGPPGAVNHMTSAARAMSRAARSRHQFDEIIIDSRVEAEDVIDKLNEVVSRYNEVSVADMYELVGVTPTHQDFKWGWTSLRGAGVTRDRNGYILDLPDPEPIAN